MLTSISKVHVEDALVSALSDVVDIWRQLEQNIEKSFQMPVPRNN
jgi:hypothetical protein